jgi:segregation and condensation protein B
MGRSKSKPAEPPSLAEGPAPPPAGVTAPPADGGLSIDRLARAFASMMGVADPYGAPPVEEKGLVAEVDQSLDLDEDDLASGEHDVACRVSPATILEALLFVGLPGGAALGSKRVAALMRGVRPQEIDELAMELARGYRANNCPYEVVSQGDGWVMRLREEFASFGRVIESRARMVRLDSDALDVLAAIAWNQPVGRDRLVELGCDAPPSALRQLVRRGLLELVAVEGADPSYRTTRKFLDVFHLASIADLPEPNGPPG